MPTRRTSRLRTAPSEAPAAGTTETALAVESVLALAAVAPLSRRAARERAHVDAPIADAPLVPADAPAAPAYAPAAAGTAAPADTGTPADTAAEAVDAPSVPASDEMPAAESEPVADDADAFERASRAFRTAGPLPSSSATSQADEARTAFAGPADDASSTDAAASHVAAPRPRRIRKIVTAGATVGVMGIAGLLAVSMTLPAEAVAAVGGHAVASTSLVAASADGGTRAADDEIQAFVAPSGVQNGSLARADDFSTMSLVEVAAEQGINYSGEVFVNDPDAAIQWPFVVGVGMSYGYGMRSGRLHEGIDFVPGNGAPVQAIADGTVRIATEQGGAYGVTVYIDHVIDGSVITSHYSHMQYGSLQVTQGQTVKVGDIVGKTGNTGRSYGAHMHFELIVNGSTIDPLPWLRANAGRYSY
ncbi:peptidoglycan DD-metalloendopeptidase family protein [Microbacterium sp. 179-I 3D2 NHS]|uniref:peptidoglycan DD-metalloendopeptidase family protein n=1 Tax=Microbacterium sp. 179-I 3D2 NHS TaxID=3235178 RepID=UPI00399F02F9